MDSKKNGVFFLVFSAFTALLVMPYTARAEIQFDPSMISNDPESIVDLSRFSRIGAQLPGNYLVDIYINGSFYASQNVRFINAEDKNTYQIKSDHTGLMACFSGKDLAGMGINHSALSTLSETNETTCKTPVKFIPDSSVVFNFQQMRLDISVPQAALYSKPRGWISPERWDEGINSTLISWQFSGSKNFGKYGNSQSQYLNLMSGINLGPWRLRDNSTWSNYINRYDRKQKWTHINTYLQRAIIPWRSELTLGDGATKNDVFDSLGFRGVQLGTDDNMFPETMRGYAPVVKGVAGSNAQVSIRQNGNVIYRTSVAAGAFVINDLYSLPSGGDLEVMVTEADGSVSVFTVPYSSVPILQRAGHGRYALTAGRYRNTSDQYSAPAFAQGTLIWGMPHNVTLYGGVQLADKYRAVASGAGINMGKWGAFSADITHADSTLTDGSRHQGQSLRFLYGRSLISTGTTFQLAGYRYSTRGFYTLDEAALKRMSGWTDRTVDVDAAGRPIKQNWINHYDLYSNKRDRLQANISQRIGDMGSLYMTGTRQTYWNSDSTTNTLQLGFSSVYKKVSYNVSYGYTRYNGQKGADKTLYLSLSVPLDSWMGNGNGHSVWANYSANRNSEGRFAHQAGLSGTAMDDGNLSWAVSQGYERRDGGSGDTSLAYQGTYGNASAGYAYSRNYRQYRYGVSGSAVLHSGGLTVGQPLGNTNVLVAAPGAAGVALNNGTGIRTDFRGYTLVPYATMYRENRVALEINGLDEQTEIDNAVASVIPTSGALVRADFKIRKGFRVLMMLTFNNKPLPFGAIISEKDTESSGLVGNDGLVYLSGLAPQGELKAKWGHRDDQQCVVRFTLPEEKHPVLIQIKEVCR